MNQSFKYIFNSKQSCYVIIDYYNNQNPIGKIINSEMVGYDFYSLTSLLKLISGLLDITDNDIRCFIEDKSEKDIWGFDTYQFDLNNLDKQRYIAAFKITVLFTQRNSWQGVIKWLDTDEELCFRSVYELINIIDNVCMCYKKVNNHIM